MPGLIVAFLAVVSGLEVARRLPLLASFRSLARTSLRSGALLRRRGSDHHKERATRMLSARMFGNSLYAGMLIIVTVSPLMIAIAADLWLDFGLLAELTSWQGRLLLLSMSVAYVLIRYRLPLWFRRSAPASSGAGQ